MYMKLIAFLLSLTAFGPKPVLTLSETRDDVRFHQLLIDEVERTHPSANLSEIRRLHFVADESMRSAMNQRNLTEAISDLSQDTLDALVKTTDELPLTQVQTPQRGQIKPLTLVLLPGDFAEFVNERGFQEIFQRSSAFREKFHQMVLEQKVTDRVSLLSMFLPNAREEDISVERNLDEVLLTGEIALRKGLVRVVAFATERGSLESLGAASDRARLFTRRLEKYLNLTGSQNLVFVGFGRGSLTALEMLTQARVFDRPWVGQVKAMVSLGGPLFGSSFADQALYKSQSESCRLMTGLAKTTGIFEYPDVFQPLPRQAEVVQRNLILWQKLVSSFLSGTLPGDDQSSSIGLDPQVPLQLLKTQWRDFNLDQYSVDYNVNLKRFSLFTSQLMSMIKEQSTGFRKHWWQTHELPPKIQYYGLTAVMADPEASQMQSELYSNPLAYGFGSVDDQFMLKAHRQYGNLGAGALNDGQVGVVQAVFLPGVISELNPANANLSFHFLGVLNSHQWGLSFAQVNASSKGKVNGYPREALLRALAVQIQRDAP